MDRSRAALLTAAVAWGVSMTTAQAALTHLPPADLIAVEVLSGTAMTALACLVTGRRIAGPWRPALLLGFFEPGLCYVLTDVGLLMTSAALGSIVLGLESVFLVLLIWVATRVRPGRTESAAVLAGFVGIAVVGGYSGGGHSSFTEVLVLVAAAATAAGYTFTGTRVAPGHEPLALVTRQGLASLLVTGPFLIWCWVHEGTRLGTAPPAVLLWAS